jgi:hypothetical protein
MRLQQSGVTAFYIINAFAPQSFSRILLFESEEGQDIGLSYLKRKKCSREEIIHKFQFGLLAGTTRSFHQREHLAKRHSTTRSFY